MQNDTEDPQNNNFFTYYIPCIFFLTIPIILVILMVLTSQENKIFVILIIFLFSLYRWFVSGWVPNILDREKAFLKEKEDYENRERQRSAEGLVIIDSSPNIFTKISIWVKSKILSIIAMLVVWIPMEIFIQTSFLIKAISASKNGEILPTRRGQWPNE